jgi:cell division protein FtsI/penicillin-binding protein 2
MPRPLTLKDHFLEYRMFTNRAIILLVFCAMLLMVLFSRLLYLQVIEHEHYITLSEDNRVKLQAIAPNRGLIYDRNGILLAENLPSFRLQITPEQVDDMASTLEALEEIIHISDVDRSRFERLLARKPRFEAIPLRFHLDDTEVARFSVNRHRFPGVDIHAGLSRHYPLGSLGVHVLGYVGRIDEQALKELDTSNYSGTTHTGKIGIEKTYEDVLHGKVGVQHVETTAQGRVLRVLRRMPPVPGNNLYLTLDSRLQAAAEQAFGDFSGSAIALDPRTGDVLAMVSQPTYDPNPFVNGIEFNAYNALRDDERPIARASIPCKAAAASTATGNAPVTARWTSAPPSSSPAMSISTISPCRWGLTGCTTIWRISPSAAAPASTSSANCPDCCPRRPGNASAAASPGSRGRPSSPVSARAFSWLRRCNWPHPRPRSPTTARSSGRRSCMPSRQPAAATCCHTSCAPANPSPSRTSITGTRWSSP